MNDMQGALAPAEEALVERDHLGSVDCEIKVDELHTFEATLDVYGEFHEGEHATRDTPGSPRGYSIDRVMWGRLDITANLPERTLDYLARWAKGS